MKRKLKPKPEPPHHFWYNDCWLHCDKKTCCGSCKVLKQQTAEDKRKRTRIEKQKIRNIGV